MTIVARVSCAAYAEVGRAVERSLELLGGPERFARSGEPLLVKPNLLAAHPADAAVTTHPAVLDALLRVASDLGAKAVVGDSPGLGAVRRVARVAGILEVCRRHGVPLLDLGDEEAVPVSGSAYRQLEVARAALEAPWLWNVAKWKTHAMMGLTLSVKNLFGCVPGKRKIRAHFRSGRDPDGFARQLLGLCEVLAPALNLLDGVVAMDGEGPSRGRPIPRGLLLASASPAALDWEATRLSGFPPARVPTVHLSLAAGEVVPAEIQIAGDSAEPMRFRPANGTPCDWPLPGFLRDLVRRMLSPAPSFSAALCTGCGVCADACPAAALVHRAPPEFSQQRCIRCYCCQELCPSGAVAIPGRGLGAVFRSAQGRRP
ncbi:MAG: DUF362 domain-containing protein [Deltaproteobacteria bacterium]|nr:DUF362 domain-containing protein [Deltaproteobacteria bacterium]